MRIFFHLQLQTFGRQLSLRQRVLASAEVYLTRFFLKVSIHEVNVYLVIAACVYLACKTEECPQHIRTIASEARVLWPDFITHDATKIAECEFYLIEELDTQLITHHPYKSLIEIARSMSQSYNQLALTSEEIQSAWSIINDSYACDAIFLSPPHIIAVAAVFITVVLKSPLVRPARPPERIKQRIDLLSLYLGESGIDLEEVAVCIQELISLYARWEHFDEAACRGVIARELLGSG